MKSLPLIIKSVLKGKSKFVISLMIFLTICGSVLLYTERSHLGYFVYLYSLYTNSETRQLENNLTFVLQDRPSELFDEFKGYVESVPQNANVCHGIAHKLGHKSYELYGFDMSMQIAKPYCGAGFIHGVIESKFGALRDTKAIRGIPYICDAKDEKCNHGIGHGLMVLTKNKFKDALTHCDTLEVSARSDCYDGVFMHIFDNEETGISKNIPEREEGISLCSRIEDRYKKSCYFYAPRIYASDDLHIESKKMCDQALGEDKIICIVGSGTMIGKYVFDNPDKANTMCDVFGENTNLCKEGIVMYRDNTF